MHANEHRYDEQIDGLRAHAVGGVLYAYFYAAETLVGHLGVRLFFVLSGFLITRILLNARYEEGYAFGRALGVFYARRFLRIFPAYYLLVGVSYAVGAMDDGGGGKWFVTYLSNFLYAQRNEWAPWALGHT